MDPHLTNSVQGTIYKQYNNGGFKQNAISENDKLLYHYLSEVLQALISYIVPQNKEDKTTTCHLYSAIRFSSDPERTQKTVN